MTSRPHESSDLASMRVRYGGDADITPDDLRDGWLPVLRAWLQLAVDAGAPEPNAFVLATVDSEHRPATRTVLCKGLDSSGVVFYTNFGSDKGRHLAANPASSATFPWIAVQRQVTVRGTVVRTSDEETREYWATRPRGSQLGAHASAQSRHVASRDALERQLADVTERYDGRDVPVPDGWGGFRIRPESVEFWQGRDNRLHNRIRVNVASDGSTSLTRLQP